MSFQIDKKTIDYCKTGRGVAFYADLLLDGEKVGTVENGGNGGDTFARCKADVLLKLDDVAQEAVPDSCEPTSQYLEKLMDAAEGVQ